MTGSMRDMRWTPEVVTTLLVRVAGVALFVWAVWRVPGHIDFASSYGWGRSPAAVTIRHSLGFITTAAVLAAGSYCFFSGRWLIDRLLAGLPRAGRCSRCGYDLSGLAEGERCPECGFRTDNRSGSGS